MNRPGDTHLPDTRDRILEVAERLFAEHGFAASSLRTITAEAGANLAAVNYHFGSKDGLVREVLSRRVDPLNRERLALLEHAMESAGHEGPPLERIVDAFVGPALRMSQDPEQGGRVFMRLFGHAMSQPDPQLREFITGKFGVVAQRFHAALSRALPALDGCEVYWRMLFMVGSMVHTMAMADQLHALTCGMCDARDLAGTRRRLVAFVAAGLRASVPPSGAPE